MKKVVTLVLSAAMLLSSTASAMTRTEFITASGLGADLVPKSMNVNVDANITVRKTADAAFKEGPINITKKSSDDFPEFDFRADLYMDKVRSAFMSYYEKALLVTPVADLNDLHSTPVNGEFTITVKFPDELEIPDEMIENNQLATGFGERVYEDGKYKEDKVIGADENPLTVFEEVSRTLTTEGKNTKVLTIVINVAGVENEEGVRETLTCKDLADNLYTYLPDLYLQCDAAATTDYGTYKVSGSVEGYTHIGDTSEPISTVYYNAVQKGETSDKNLYAQVSVAKKSTGGGHSGRPITIPQPPTTGTQDDINVIFDIAGNVVLVDPITSNTPFELEIEGVEAPEFEGYIFEGWYEDKSFQKKATGTHNISKDTIYYGKYILKEPVSVFDNNDGKHNLYIMGYPDGTVQPTGNITREEVAKALYRLLRKDIRDSITVETNNFPDVENERWSNISISSMASAGYLEGYEDGTFRPGNPITRAEFATIALRFFTEYDTHIVGLPYTDIAGHWAEENVIAATRKFIINGYEDNTFRPDNYISRAEAMTIINRLTIRHTDADGLVEGFKDWPDLQPTDWYYYEVLEATNPHSYERREDGYYENWTGLLENEFLIEDK